MSSGTQAELKPPLPHEKTHFDREAAAVVEIGHTDFSPGVPLFLLVAVLASFLVVPVLQVIHDLREHRAGRRASALPQCLEIFPAMPKALRALAQDGRSPFQRVLAMTDSLHDDIARYEQAIKEDNVAVNAILPRTQELLLGTLGAGNEKAYAGRDGWLFFRPDIDYLTARGFLEPGQLTRRRHSGDRWTPAPQPDPVKAIVHFKEQLARRGIQLLVLPVPAKSMIQPEKFSNRYDKTRRTIRNASFARFQEELIKQGVLVFDPTEILAEARSGASAPQYLETDTHWTPQAVERVTERLAKVINAHLNLPATSPAAYQREEISVAGLGDIAVMLKLPPDQKLYRPQSVSLQQVTQGKRQLWRPAKSSDVLLLGDSFANIFSLEGMGWGESAGFAEQLSFHLQRPLDCLLRNDSGAFATREMLSRELAKGRDRLAGKKLVIWEFAQRELAFGDWKLLNLEVGQPPPRQFLVPPGGQELTATGVIESISTAPKPGSVPYKDHLVSMHLTDLESAGQAGPGNQAVVYLWSMRDNVWTSAARFRAGQKITVKLRPWSDVSEKLERINRSELGDETLQLEEPCWGEPVETH